MIRHLGGRRVDWEPSSAQPILDSVTELVAIEVLLDMTALCYCERYHFDGAAIISVCEPDDPITCQHSNYELPPNCLDDDA